MGWVVLILFLTLVVFLVAWWRFSSIKAFHPLVSPEELNVYFDDIFSRIGLPQIRDKIVSDIVNSDRISLHLDILESEPEDPVVILIPGTSVYALFYAEFMYKLNQRGFNVIGFDPRGHGQSEGLRGSYTIEEIMRDTMTVIDYARVKFNDNIAVIGSSQGGIVAFYLAAADAGIKAAVCHNLAILNEPDIVQIAKSPTMLRLGRLALPFAAKIFPEFQVPVSLYLSLKQEEMKVFGNAQKFLDEDPLALKYVSLKALASLLSTPPAKSARDISTPIMVVHGEKDEIFPREYIEKIFDKIGGPKQFFIVKGAPHLVMTEKVDEMIPEVEAWLRKELKSG
jgi:alpha-beta hydrolase superfamily lysophospholipase